MKLVGCWDGAIAKKYALNFGLIRKMEELLRVTGGESR
jgi:hypothetical protein